MISATIDCGSTSGRNHEPGQRVVYTARRPGTSAVYVIRDRLGGMRLRSDIGVKAPRKIGHRVRIEFVAFIAVGLRVLRSKVEEVAIAKSEGITLVRIVVLIDRVRIVGIEQETVAQPLPEANRYASIEGLRPAIRICHVSKVWKYSMRPDIVDGVLTNRR